jgi:SAM-dependent methyltransferase
MNWLHRHYCSSSRWRRTLDGLVPWALDGVSLGDHVLELGPGPGQVTPMLLSRRARVTAIDRDPTMATALRLRRSGGAAIVRGDATTLPFAVGTFSAVVAFTMLHHIPTTALQDRLFHEAFRALRPGGVFVGMDPRMSLGLRLVHLGDTCVPLAPETISRRLAAAGFHHIAVEARSGYVKFSGTRGSL